MAEAEKPPCAEIIWKIENFTYCWQEKGERLTSSKFFVECLDKTSWHLFLNPKGDSRSDDLGLFLQRAVNDEGNEDVVVKFEMAVLEDGNLPYKTCVSKDHSFPRNESWGWSSFISRSDILKNAEKLYSKNVLTVRCKMWHVNAEESCCPTVHYLRTLIPVTQCSFEWNIDLAAVETSDQEKTVAFPSLFGSGDFLKFTLSYVTRNCDSKLLKISISGGIQKEYSFKCGIRTVQTKEDFFLKLSKINTLPYEKLYEPILTQNQVNKITETFAMTNTVMLKCELSVISHEEENDDTQSIEKSEQSSLWCPEIYGKYGKLNPVKIANEKSGDCSCALKEDVLKMYQEGFKSDYTLQAESQTFPVHSVILSARSEVLNRMFDAEMKEKQEKILKIEDLDGNTVKKMLDYLYTDKPGKLDMESALKLYYAGDKYELFGLKKLCCEYLMQNIAICNLYDILMLAYRHNDKDLKSSAIQFISENEKDVVLSDQFKTFTKNHLDFGMEIVQGLFEYKFKG